MPARVDVERGQGAPERPGRPLRRGQPTVVQGQREDHHEQAGDRARHHEHRQLVAREDVDDVRAAHRRERQAHAEDPGHRAALGDRYLVRQHGHLGGEQRVEEDLRHAPAEQHHGDVRCERDDQDPGRSADETGDHPRSPPAEPGRGPVAQPAADRVGHHRHERTDPRDQRQVGRRSLDADQGVDLERQGHQQRRDEQQGSAEVRQRVQADEPRPTRCSAARGAADVVPDIVPPRLGSDGSPSPRFTLPLTTCGDAGSPHRCLPSRSSTLLHLPKGTTMNRFTRGIASAAARHPWRTIATWVVVLGAVFALAGSGGGGFIDAFSAKGSQSERALRLLEDKFPEATRASALVVFAVDDGDDAAGPAAGRRRRPGRRGRGRPCRGRGRPLRVRDHLGATAGSGTRRSPSTRRRPSWARESSCPSPSWSTRRTPPTSASSSVATPCSSTLPTRRHRSRAWAS